MDVSGALGIKKFSSLRKAMDSFNRDIAKEHATYVSSVKSKISESVRKTGTRSLNGGITGLGGFGRNGWQ